MPRGVDIQDLVEEGGHPDNYGLPDNNLPIGVRPTPQEVGAITAKEVEALLDMGFDRLPHGGAPLLLHCIFPVWNLHCFSVGLGANLGLLGLPDGSHNR